MKSLSQPLIDDKRFRVKTVIRPDGIVGTAVECGLEVFETVLGTVVWENGEE